MKIKTVSRYRETVFFYYDMKIPPHEIMRRD